MSHGIRKPLYETIEENHIIDAETGCHNWTGFKDISGYGRIDRVIDDKQVQFRAHRVSYEHHKGTIPDDLFCIHTCDNRACVNPKHLRIGTHQDNMDDRSARNRQIKGEDHKDSILKEQDVLDIRERYKFRSPKNSQAALAREYGVSYSCIHYITSRHTWKHI